MISSKEICLPGKKDLPDRFNLRSFGHFGDRLAVYAFYQQQQASLAKANAEEEGN